MKRLFARYYHARFGTAKADSLQSIIRDGWLCFALVALIWLVCVLAMIVS